MEIRKVGVVGTGAMGLGIVQVCAASGLEVVAVKATPGSTDKAKEKLEKSVAKLVEKGKIDEAAKSDWLGRASFSAELSALKGCDLVVESIVEDLATKLDFFTRIEDIVGEKALIATNTSTLSVTTLQAACKHRNRIAGLHFFNPAPVMKLVEVVHAFETSDETVKTLQEFCGKVGKAPVIVKDSTGFIVNRLLTPYMLSAMHLYEQGIATIDEIDQAMMNGAAHPMGPLTLADFIGLDVVIAMSENIYADGRERLLAPTRTLRQLVELGHLGRKTGKGFYDYSQKPAVPNPDLKR